MPVGACEGSLWSTSMSALCLYVMSQCLLCFVVCKSDGSGVDSGSPCSPTASLGAWKLHKPLVGQPATDRGRSVSAGSKTGDGCTPECFEHDSDRYHCTFASMGEPSNQEQLHEAEADEPEAAHICPAEVYPLRLSQWPYSAERHTTLPSQLNAESLT